MNNFPPLDTWFTIRVNVETPYPYTRYDLCLIPEGDLEDFAWYLSLLISRLRLNTNEYAVWEKYWIEGVSIPDEWIPRFQDRFWRGFISNKATEEADGQNSPLFNLRIQNELENQKLASLRDTLLPKLISGELRVPDAENIVEEVV